MPVLLSPIASRFHAILYTVPPWTSVKVTDKACLFVFSGYLLLTTNWMFSFCFVFFTYRRNYERWCSSNGGLQTEPCCRTFETCATKKWTLKWGGGGDSIFQFVFYFYLFYSCRTFALWTLTRENKKLFFYICAPQWSGHWHLEKTKLHYLFIFFFVQNICTTWNWTLTLD